MDRHYLQRVIKHVHKEAAHIEKRIADNCYPPEDEINARECVHLLHYYISELTGFSFLPAYELEEKLPGVHTLIQRIDGIIDGMELSKI